EDDLRHVLTERAVTVLDGDDGHEHEPDHHGHGGPFGEHSELIFAVLSAALWGTGLVLGLTSILDGGWLTAVFVTSGLFGGWFTTQEAIESIRNGRMEIDFLMLIAAVGAAVLGRWEEGALLLALFSLGHALEGYAMGRARRAIEALADIAPATALVRRDHAGSADSTDSTVSAELGHVPEIDVPVEALAVGDLVVVKPHARIPADGFIIA